MPVRYIISVFCFLLLLCVPARVCGAEDTLSVTSADMDIVVRSGRARGRCSLVLQKSGKQLSSCRVFDQPLQATSVLSSAGLAVYKDKGVAASATESGAYTAEIDFNLKLYKSSGGREIILPVALAGAGKIRVSFPGQNVRLKSNAALKTKTDSQGTQVEVYPGKIKEVRLQIAPGIAGESGALRLAVNVSGKISYKDGMLSLACSYMCERLGGKSGRLVIDLPQGWSLDKLSGADVVSWKPIGDVKGGLPVAYSVAYSAVDKLKFTVRCSAAAGFDDFRKEITLPLPRQTERVQGSLAVASPKRGGLSVEDLKGAVSAVDGITITAIPSSFTLVRRPGRFLCVSSLEVLGDLREHVMNVKGRLGVDVTEGGGYRLFFNSSKGLRINTLKSAEKVRWQQEGSRISVDFGRRIDGRVQLEFEAEVSPEQAKFALPYLSLEGVSRQNFLFSFKAPQDYEIRHPQQAGSLMQIDAAVLPVWLRDGQYALQGEGVGKGVELSLVKSRPMIEVFAAMKAVVGKQQMHMENLFSINCRRSSVFRHILQIGKGLEVSRVRGQLIRDWDYSPSTGLLRVMLKSSSPKNYFLYYQASRAGDTAAQRIVMPSYQGATIMKGFCLFKPQAGLAVNVGKTSGLAEVSLKEMREQFLRGATFFSALQTGESLLSYSAADAEAQVSVWNVKPDVRMTQRSMLDFSPGLALYTSVLDVNILRGGVDSLVVDVPKGFSNVEISCAGRTAGKGYFRPEDVWQDKDGKYRIRFPSIITALPAIVVSCEKVLPISGEVTIAPVNIEGSQRTSGSLSVYKPAGDEGAFIDIQQKGNEGFDRKVVLGEGTFKAAGKTLLGDYTFEAPSAVLNFGVSATGSRILQSAKVSECELDTRLTDAGKLLTRLRCTVENPAGQQFMAVRMPGDSKVWGTFSDGEAVKVVEDMKNGHLLVPLAVKPGSSKNAFDIDLIYEQQVSGAGIGLTSLRLDTPLLSEPGQGGLMQVDNTVWKLWVPNDYELVRNSGTLNFSGGHKAGASYLLDFVRELFWGLLGLAYSLLGSLLMLVLKVLRILLPVLLIGLIVFMLWQASRKKYRTWVPRLLSSGISVVLVVILVVVLFSMMLSGPLMSARTSALQASSANNLKGISTAIFQYSSPSYYGTSPTSFEDLFRSKLLDNQKILHSPLGGHYAFAGIMPNARGNDIVAVEILDDPSEGRAHVLFKDGHVKSLKNDQIIANLQGNRNYALLTPFVDNLQKAEFASSANEWNWGKKGKKMASLDREARELQNMQNEILVNQSVQTNVELSDEIKKANDFNLNQSGIEPRQSLKSLERVNVSSETRNKGIRSLLNKSGLELQSRRPERFNTVSDSLVDVSDVPMESQLSTSKIKSNSKKPREMRRRSNNVTKGKVSVDKLSKRNREDKAREFQKEWLQSQRVEVAKDEDTKKPADELLDADKEVPGIPGIVEEKAEVLDDESVAFGEDSDDQLEVEEMSLEGLGAEDGNHPVVGRLRIQSKARYKVGVGGGTSTPALPPVPEATPVPAPAVATAPVTGFVAAEDSSRDMDEKSKISGVSHTGPSYSFGAESLSLPAVATGALPVNVDIPQNGSFLEFSRGAASGGAELNLFFFSRGVSIALELLIAAGLIALILYLRRKFPQYVIPFCAVVLVLCVTALQWAQSSYRPHLMVAIAVTVVALGLKVLSLFLKWAGRQISLRVAH